MGITRIYTRLGVLSMWDSRESACLKRIITASCAVWHHRSIYR